MNGGVDTDAAVRQSSVPPLLNSQQSAGHSLIKPGVEIGWLGFPALPRADLCFFSGRISAYIGEISAYLVDGVAINGVSGGPAFWLGVKTPYAVGIVSAYIPNRATGEVLPGVAVVRDATQFHDLVQRFRSFDEAKKQETPPAEAPPGAESGTTEPPAPSATGGPTRS